MSNIQRQVVRSAGGQIIGQRDPAEETGAQSQEALDARVAALEGASAGSLYFSDRDPLDQVSEAEARADFILSPGVEFDPGDTVQVGSITLTAAASPANENEFEIITLDPEAQLTEMRRAFRDHSSFDSEPWRVSPPDLIPFSTDWAMRFEANEAGAAGNNIDSVSSRQNSGFGSRIGFFNSGAQSTTTFADGVDAQVGDGENGAQWLNLTSLEAFVRLGAEWASAGNEFVFRVNRISLED